MTKPSICVFVGLLCSSAMVLAPGGGRPSGVAHAAPEGERHWSFDADKRGSLPEGFTSDAGEWKIVEDPSAPSGKQVLAQLAENSRPTFNVVLVRDSSLRDVDVSLRFRAVAGRIDQGGGPVWRARDARNYYIARYNPLEANYRVYKVVDGQRTQLGTADIEPSDGWHALRVAMVGDRIRCYYDDKLYLDVRDPTFDAAGKVGLWTKADAQTYFDDLQARDAGAARLDPALIASASGSEATEAPDGVVRIGWPRHDVAVLVDGMPLRPFAGLGSWAAFAAAEHGAMLMGDTVVFEDEVEPAMDAAFAAGLEITALHNHFFFDEPKVYFMHIGGAGEAKDLARGVKVVWDAIKAVRARSAQPATRFPGGVPAAGALDKKAIEAIVGHDAALQDGVVKMTIGRSAEMHGLRFGGSMGLTTWAAFSGSDALASIDGDFAMTAKEVQPVLRALRKSGIHVVALHNHMVGEQPAYYFTHFWGKGPAADLAQAFRRVLDAQRAVSE
jgi:hypothetical protein